MKILQSAVDKAAAELAKLQKARLQLEDGILADEGRLVEQRAQAADVELAALLDETEASVPGALPVPRVPRPNVAALEAVIEAKRKVRPKLIERLRAAILALAHVKAEELRRTAAKKAKELGEYTEERAKLLTALEQFTGARWLVDLSHSGPTLLLGGHAQIRTGTPAPEDRGVVLSAEIDDLKRQAGRLESEAVGQTEGGAASGGTLEELLAEIEKRPLAPLPSAVRAWFQQTEAREAALWAERFPDATFRAPSGALAGLGGGQTVESPADRVTSYTLAWSGDAVIDRQRSGAVSRLGALVDGGEAAAKPLETYVYRSA